jgi:hypothetical protein
LDKSPPTPTLEEFLACCDRECEFLVRDYGFERLSSPKEYNEYSVRFRKMEFGVDIYGENWGAAASCDLIRGKDNVYLGLLVPAAARSAPRAKRSRPGQLAQIQTIASVLKEHAADFLSGDVRRFDAALAEWKRVTQPRPVSEAQRLDRQRQTAVTEAGHASKRGNYAEVVRLLEPHAKALSQHQLRMLETARQKLKDA